MKLIRTGLVRCEKNEKNCPLTSCLKSLEKGSDGFSVHEESELIGLFTCRCPGDGIAEMAKILKSKGAEMIHFCTCTFAHRENGKWVNGDGFCNDIDALIQKAADESGLPCVKGSAHLPEGYNAEIIRPR